jgi:hypothetical protein
MPYAIASTWSSAPRLASSDGWDAAIRARKRAVGAAARPVHAAVSDGLVDLRHDRAGGAGYRSGIGQPDEQRHHRGGQAPVKLVPCDIVDTVQRP